MNKLILILFLLLTCPIYSMDGDFYDLPQEQVIIEEFDENLDEDLYEEEQSDNTIIWVSLIGLLGTIATVGGSMYVAKLNTNKEKK